MFDPIPELVITIGISSKETKAEIEINIVNTEGKTRKCSIWFRVFVLLNYELMLLYFLKEISSSFIYIFQFKFLAYVSSTIF